MSNSKGNTGFPTLDRACSIVNVFGSGLQKRTMWEQSMNGNRAEPNLKINLLFVKHLSDVVGGLSLKGSIFHPATRTLHTLHHPGSALTQHATGSY